MRDLLVGSATEVCQHHTSGTNVSTMFWSCVMIAGPRHWLQGGDGLWDPWMRARRDPRGTEAEFTGRGRLRWWWLFLGHSGPTQRVRHGSS